MQQPFLSAGLVELMSTRQQNSLESRVHIVHTDCTGEHLATDCLSDIQIIHNSIFIFSVKIPKHIQVEGPHQIVGKVVQKVEVNVGFLVEAPDKNITLEMEFTLVWLVDVHAQFYYSYHCPYHKEVQVFLEDIGCLLDRFRLQNTESPVLILHNQDDSYVGKGKNNKGDRWPLLIVVVGGAEQGDIDRSSNYCEGGYHLHCFCRLQEKQQNTNINH